MNRLRLGLVASVGKTLDAFFPSIVETWRGEGHAVSLAAGTPSSIPGAEVLPDLTRAPRPRNVRALGQLARWAHTHSLDLIVTNTATASALVRHAKTNRPVVYFCHGLHWGDRVNLAALPWQIVERRLAMQTAGVITMNRNDDEWFATVAPFVPRCRLDAGVGLDLERYARRPMPRAAPPRLCWIGELTPRKRPRDALLAAAALRSKNVDFHLDMLGDGPQHAELLRMRDRLGLNDVVTLHGHQPVDAFLESASVVVHTALWEGLPRALLEAVAVGRPVIAYDVKGVRDIPGARLTENGVPGALAKVVAGMLHDGIAEPSVNVDLSSRYAAMRILDFLIGLGSARSRT